MASTSPHCLPPKALIGMVHLRPLPGSPEGGQPLADLIASACTDARVLAEAGFDAILIENFGDAPFRATQVDPHTVACMTAAVRSIRGAVGLPLGVNVLRNDPLAALAIAHTAGASFVRVNVHCGVYATDQGIIEGRADETLRYRRRLNSCVAVFADVHVKHARPLASLSIAEAAEEAAYRGRADALIVSGTGTGKPTSKDDVRAVKQAVPDRALYVGSGATSDNIAEILRFVDGVIVGTALKAGGQTIAPVDHARAADFARAART